MHALIKLTYITGKIWLPYDPEESDEDSLCATGFLLRPAWTGITVRRSKTKKRLRLAPPRSLANITM